jgi:hypothetical protein
MVKRHLMRYTVSLSTKFVVDRMSRYLYRYGVKRQVGSERRFRDPPLSKERFAGIVIL